MAERVTAVQAIGLVARLDQSVPQAALEQVDPEPRFAFGHARMRSGNGGKSGFDLPKSLYDHGVILAMRPAMQRQCKPHGRFFSRWKKQAVRPEIVEAECRRSDPLEQGSEALHPEELARQQMVSL